LGTEKLDKVCAACLRKLCRDISDRSVGSEGNRAATDYFKQELVSLGWDAEVQEFDAFDWESGGAELRVCGRPGAGGRQARSTRVRDEQKPRARGRRVPLPPDR
jgi:hypothetical protein